MLALLLKAQGNGAKQLPRFGEGEAGRCSTVPAGQSPALPITIRSGPTPIRPDPHRSDPSRSAPIRSIPIRADLIFTARIRAA
jgi:hypothetical protein